MTLAEHMHVLGLGEAASIEQIKRAYRRLALQLHPDKRAGDPTAQARFIEISQAYRSLVNAARAIEQGKSVGSCWDCGAFGEVKVGIDGHARCGHCIFRPAGGRLLPLPVYVAAKCTITILLLAAGVYLVLAALATGSRTYGIAASLAGFLGLASLAVTCLSIVQCIRPRRWAARESKNRR